ncbi:MAG: pyrimidine-nucleoside phosphorylase [Bacillota bacterium]
MRTVDLIQKKRDGFTLSRSEIEYLIQDYTAGRIPDYQIAALAMAIYYQGLSPEETVDLTRAMVNSGETMDLSQIEGVVVDKHSTGGVGDTTSLILTPLLAAAGLKVAKMSGRGLGHTGGTIDKLEAIPGLKTELTIADFIHQVNRIGLAIIAQTGNLVPADKKLYALRDVTATVDSLPLIAASIMSKKIAAGAHIIVLDIKVGDGAFMKTTDDAFSLAKLMVDIGCSVGRPTAALITDMNQPLGHAVGNALEIKEAIQSLKGQGPADLLQLCLTLGAQLLKLAGRVKEIEEGQDFLQEILAKGLALEKFAQMIEAQGGRKEVIDDSSLLPGAGFILEAKAPATGYVKNILCAEVGRTAMDLGAGRQTLDDAIDPAVGLVLNKKVGDEVIEGEPLACIHANCREKGERAVNRILSSYQIAPSPPELPPLIYGLIPEE